MAHHYSDPKREADPHSLPDIETWQADGTKSFVDEGGMLLEAGWYWWACFPGCLPDGDPFGPFATEEEALADARETDQED